MGIKMTKSLLASGIAWIALVAAGPMTAGPAIVEPVTSVVIAPGPITQSVPVRALTNPASVSSPAVAKSGPIPLEDLMTLRDAAGAAWTPDGKDIIISTNITGRYNLWSVPVAGGFPQQLVQSEETQSAIAVSPDSETILFQSDKAGNSIHDIFTLPRSGGTPLNLTNTPEVDEAGALFAPGGRTLAISLRPADQPSGNLAILDLATKKIRALTDEKDKAYSWAPVAFAADGKSIIANRYDADHASAAIFRIDIATGRAEALTPNKPDAYHESADMSANGRWLSLAVDNKAGVRQAAVLDLQQGNIVTLLQPSEWEQSAGRFAPDSNHVSVTTNVDGRTVVTLVTPDSRKIRTVALPEGVNNEAGFSPDGSHMLAAHSSGNRPFDFWKVDLAANSAKPFTRFGLGSLSADILPKTSLVHYASADGTVISAFLWMPANLKRDGSAPGIVLPHGGPSEQAFDNFDVTAAALASRGYVVIAPNFRGSTGYGRAFKMADRYDLGGGDLVDTVHAAKFIAATGYVNEKYIGITGGSYGGFMTMMALGRTPDVFAAGVAGYGIVNWFTMYTDQDISVQQYQRALIGDPVKNRDVYIASSPLTYLDKVKAPLLVLQGDNDPQVPHTEAKQVIRILKARNVTVEGKFYPDEGHGFSKRENALDALQRTISWFDTYLKPKRP
jgi:dipeptidyl aminopeptidase/acylaminoacyl peptidase